MSARNARPARSPPSGQGPCETRPVRRYLDRLEAHRFLTGRTRRATGWRSEELVVIDTLRHGSRIGSRRAPSDDASVIGLAEAVIVDRIPGPLPTIAQPSSGIGYQPSTSQRWASCRRVTATMTLENALMLQNDSWNSASWARAGPARAIPTALHAERSTPSRPSWRNSQLTPTMGRAPRGPAHVLTCPRLDAR